MEKNKVISEGYMTVGIIAKKVGVTVRTLQHYDKEGFLSPTAESVGGRRLYSDKDLIRLHQVLSLKHLGFSLKDIKDKIISLDTPTDVAKILTDQAVSIQKEIKILSDAYEEILLLKAEVLQMQLVDFKKYADIIVNIQMKNEHYWLIKHFDEQTLDHVRGRFDKESGMAFMNRFTGVNKKSQKLLKNNVPPDSDEGQQLAKDFWEMIMEFTAGDMSMIPKLMEIGNISKSATESKQKNPVDMVYIEKALDVYLTKLGLDPFGEETK